MDTENGLNIGSMSRADYRELSEYERAALVEQAEVRAREVAQFDFVKQYADDFTTRAGFVATSRKAFVAAVGAFAAAFGPALVLAGADGVITWGEVVPSLVIGATLAGGTFLATWRVPNAEG